jgi:predicted PurR-regulated permease PerM
MENKDMPGGKTNKVEDVVKNVSGNSIADQRLQAERAARRQGRQGQGLFGKARARLRASGNVPRGTSRGAGDTLQDTARNVDEVVEETSRADEIMLDLARWTRRFLVPLAILAWAGVAILVLWAAGHVTRAILLLVIAALLAYALAPLVTFLERVIPRLLAILVVYLVVLGGISALLYLVVSAAVGQITSLSGYLGSLLTPQSGGHLTPLEQTLMSFGISSSQIASLRAQLIAQTEGLAGDIVPLLTGLVNATLDIIVVAVLSIYLLIDGTRVTNWLRRNMPRRQQGRVRFLLETLQRIVGGYIRGQILLCGLIGVLVGGGMGILRVPYALLLGVLAFVLEFIPVLGTLVSGAICVLLALTQGWVLALIVLVYFIIVHIIEGDVVGPRIVGKAIGLHPVISLVALIAGAELFGIWGALLASPVAGVLQSFLVAIWAEWRETHPQEFQRMKNKVSDKVEENVAEKPIDPEPAAKLLSDSE